MVEELRGSIVSPNVQRALLVAYEVDYHVKVVDVTPHQQKAPEFKTLQPFGQVPVLVRADNENFFESRAIARYFVVSKKSPLLPIHDPIRYGAVETWINAEGSHWSEAGYVIGFEGHIRNFVFPGTKPDEARAAKSLERFKQILDIYEKRFSRDKFVSIAGGNEVTLADLFHLPVGHLVFKHVHPELLNQPQYEGVKKWWDHISKTKGWQAVLTELAKGQ